MNFYQLHQQQTPLLIANVWDVVSAKAAMQAGYTALGTSSAAIASSLGFNDGEEMTFSQLLFIVERITATVNLPLSVDIEAGYSEDVDAIIDNIKQLAALGVVGINIEDSHVITERRLDCQDAFADKVCAIKHALASDNIEMFINVRTDTFLLGIEDALAHTLSRIEQYQAAGADGIFIPCITLESDIQACVNATVLPINVMCMPQLANFSRLGANGVRRISMGSFLHEKTQRQLSQSFEAILTKQSFSSIF